MAYDQHTRAEQISGCLDRLSVRAVYSGQSDECHQHGFVCSQVDEWGDITSERAGDATRWLDRGHARSALRLGSLKYRSRGLDRSRQYRYKQNLPCIAGI